MGLNMFAPFSLEGGGGGCNLHHGILVNFQLHLDFSYYSIQKYIFRIVILEVDQCYCIPTGTIWVGE